MKSDIIKNMISKTHMLWLLEIKLLRFQGSQSHLLYMREKHPKR